MLVHFARAALLVQVLAAAVATAASAQTTLGGVNGTIADTQGGVLPGSAVTLINEATQITSMSGRPRQVQFVFRFMF